jgi:hypothetical protein
MKLTIGDQAIELLEGLDLANLTEVQAQTYRLLLSLGEGTHSERELVQQLGLKSPLPLRSRIRHLAEKGALRLLEAVAV